MTSKSDRVAARFVLLNRRARHGAIGAKDATIAWLRAQQCAATEAFVEELACCRGHRLRALASAFRARQGALKFQLSHRCLSPGFGRSCPFEVAPTTSRSREYTQNTRPVIA